MEVGWLVGDNRFELIDHTADLAMRVRGRDFENLLVNAARGMNSLIAIERGKTCDHSRPIEIAALDREGLLVEFLSELAYLAESEALLFQRFDLLELTSSRLRGTLSHAQRVQHQREIKAVTYHEIEVKETSDGLEAVVVFDV
jgi:SHS2 domain-containing protein